MINKLHKKLPEIAEGVHLWGKYMGVEKTEKLKKGRNIHNYIRNIVLAEKQRTNETNIFTRRPIEMTELAFLLLL